MTLKFTQPPWRRNGNSIVATWENGEEVQVAIMARTTWSYWGDDAALAQSQANNTRLRAEQNGNQVLMVSAPELYAMVGSLAARLLRAHGSTRAEIFAWVDEATELLRKIEVAASEEREATDA